MRKKVLVWCMVFVMFLMPSVVTNAEEMTDSDAQTEQEAEQSELEGTKAFQATKYFIYDIWAIEGTHFFASNGLRQTFFSSM